MRPFDEARLIELLAEAGEVAMRAQGAARAGTKEDGSIVTEADTAVETLLVDAIHGAFPEDGIEGEEGTREMRKGAHHWVIDPIDGTGAFVEGLPTWGVTVARIASASGQVVLGGLHLPRAAETFTVAAGIARRNGRALASPPVRRSPERVIYLPSTFHRGYGTEWPHKIRSLGSTALHLCLCASGAAEAAIVGPGWKPWDVACGIGALAATGCETRVFRGDRWQGPLQLDRDSGHPFVAGTPETVRWLTAPGRIHPKETRRP